MLKELLSFDPTQPEFRADPYPFYDQLRATVPIYYWEEWEIWFMTRYDDCDGLLRDNRLGNHPTGTSMLFQNPPDHTRLRSLVQSAFTPRMVERLRANIEDVTNELLDEVQENGVMDVVADLAYPLPIRVIAEMLGVPAADHTKFNKWSKALVASLDLTRDPRVEERSGEAENAFRDYFGWLIAQHRAAPQDDLLSALIAVEEAGDKLSPEELYYNSRLLLIAGYETTVGLISNGVWSLLQHPAQRVMLQENPELIESAVEELLRYDSPIQMVGRTVLQEMEWQGIKLEEGQSVGFMTGAANRDPARFANPNELELTRTNNRHLAFGAGIHYCLGAPLARVEGQIAINTLLRRLPNITAAIDIPTYRDNYVFRGLEALPVSF